MDQQPQTLTSDNPTHLGTRRARGRWMNAVAAAILLLALLIVIYMLLVPTGGSRKAEGGAPHGKLQSGHAAPAFTLRTLDGHAVQRADFAGHPLLINVWATWCVPCRQEMPAIQKAYDREHTRGFDVLAVNMMERPDAIQAFASKYQLSLPMAIDDGSLSQGYGVVVLPTSFFIDSRGIVRDVQVGAMDDDTLRGLIAEMTQG